MSNTPKRFVLQRINNAIRNKISHAILYVKSESKILYAVGNNITDITEPLMALYQYFADIEDEYWREKLRTKFAKPKKYKFVMNKKPKVYISGKVSGLSEVEYKSKFNSTELFLTGLGYDVVNPTSLDEIKNGSWVDYMKRDLKLLLDCDYIYLLDNWDDSKGACIEYNLACDLQIPRLLLDFNGKVL